MSSNSDYKIVAKPSNKGAFLSLYFSETNEQKQYKCYTLALGCKLLIDPTTKKFRVLQIPIHSLGCELQNTSFLAQYEATDCFVISLRSLSPEDRVKTKVDYMDSIIFDTQDDKIVRIEIIGVSQLLDL